ncbi:MAG: hypothetical protein IK132_06605 [Clostridia bacterium]|nr:hypothetical protein [Clostridia bacterium]
MARCANCGCAIPDDDKTRLCDGCKRILLPFVKFMDVSSTSAVRRLVSNEGNLRQAGVTDSGMEYLYRICELHDRRKQTDREERAARRQAQAEEQEAERLASEERAREEERQRRMPMEEIELPPDEPMRLHPPIGKLLGAAKVALILAGLMMLAWFVVRIVMKLGMDVTPLAGGIASLIGAYAVSVCEKLRDDLEEIKRRFFR